ncbi:MAG: DnaJ domain-containing protein [Pseudomonadota bacterium]
MAGNSPPEPGASSPQAPDPLPDSDLIPAEREAIDELYARVRKGDVYSILGVSPDADVQHIRKVYYELSRSWHPDQFYRRNIGSYKQKLEDIFVGVNRAYTVLTDSRRRADYDQEHGTLARADIKPAPTRPGAGEEGPSGAVAEGAEHEIRFSVERQRSEEERVRAAQEVLVARPRRRRRGRIPGMERIHEQVMVRVSRARRYHQAAEREAEAGNWIAAASNAYVAMTFDPEDVRYRQLWEECDPKGRQQKARQFIQLAESALSYHNLKAAIQNYQKACDANPPEADPYFQLARLMQSSEEDRDDREIMKLLRRATELSPRTVRFRLALADFCADQGLIANARREYEEALRIEPGNADAKAGLRKVRR